MEVRGKTFFANSTDLGTVLFFQENGFELFLREMQMAFTCQSSLNKKLDDSF